VNLIKLIYTFPRKSEEDSSSAEEQLDSNKIYQHWI
jgi:hypothetical protein